MSSPAGDADAATTALAELRVALPHQLRTLAGVTGEVRLAVAPPVTLGAALDALEATHPALRGTIRPHDGGTRRPLVRLYAHGEDLSSSPPWTPLPTGVVAGREPLRVVGAIAGG